MLHDKSKKNLIVHKNHKIDAIPQLCETRRLIQSSSETKGNCY